MLLAVTLVLVGDATPAHADPPRTTQFPPATWTHRDFADHIKKKGTTLSLKPAGLVLMAGPRPVAILREGTGPNAPGLLVFLCADEQGAREMAATMGEGAFAFGRFATGALNPDASGDGPDDAGLLKRVAAALK